MPVSQAFPTSGLLLHQTQTSLGWAAIARSNQGICGIALGDTPDQVLLEICTRHSRSSIHAWPEDHSPDLQAVLECLENPAQSCQAQLHLVGTPFQQQVWQLLLAIPPGNTRSYGELAVQLGRPGAARAIAAACAANPLAVVVPCHRVVGRHGKLTGYRWGLDRKAELLRRETLLYSALCA